MKYPVIDVIIMFFPQLGEIFIDDLIICTLCLIERKLYTEMRLKKEIFQTPDLKTNETESQQNRKYKKKQKHRHKKVEVP